MYSKTIYVNFRLIDRSFDPHAPWFLSYNTSSMKYLLLPSICPEVQASHKKYSRDHVSESDRQYIVQHHIFNGHLRTIEHTVRNQEHVCDRVLEVQEGDGHDCAYE